MAVSLSPKHWINELKKIRSYVISPVRENPQIMRTLSLLMEVSGMNA